MTTIDLSATDTFRDLMPGRAIAGKSPRTVTGNGARASVASLPLRWRLLPRWWRDALVHRARQRELEMAFERLSETSAHLLADVGLVAPSGVVPAAPTWTRALPPPGTSPAGLRSLPIRLAALSRSRRRLAELDDRLLADVGLGRNEAHKEARRPAWNAPAAWLR